VFPSRCSTFITEMIRSPFQEHAWDTTSVMTINPARNFMGRDCTLGAGSPLGFPTSLATQKNKSRVRPQGAIL
jgi:hypothetical protein